MRKYEVKITRQALAQMKEITYYISCELCAPEAANILADKIEKAMLTLSELPQKYALLDEEPWRTEGVRKMIVKNFVIYFWIDEENDKVQVMAIIYNKRDQIKQLQNLDRLE